jgi:hypothetical protein
MQGVLIKPALAAAAAAAARSPCAGIRLIETQPSIGFKMLLFYRSSVPLTHTHPQTLSSVCKTRLSTSDIRGVIRPLWPCTASAVSVPVQF